MTIGPVTELTSFYSLNSGGMKDSDFSGSGGMDFSSAMENVAKHGNSGNLGNSGKDLLYEKKAYTEPRQSDDNFKENRIRKIEDSDKQINDQSNTTKESDSLGNGQKDVTEGNDKQLTELKDKILKEAADDLGVSIEELEMVLQELSLTAADLFNPENVSVLASYVLGDGQISDILTNESISDAVMNINADITELVNNSATEMEIDTDLLKSYLTEFIGGEENVEIAEPIQTKSENNVHLGDAFVDYSAEPNENSELNSISLDDSITASNDENEAYEADSKSDENNGGTNNNFAPNMEVQNQNQPANINSAPDISYSSINPEEILEQVKDSIKASVREDVTQLSVQLNPENLGNVNLTVAAKEGTITAYLITENEAVSAALESQLAMIKEALNEQGVKIEAIEVMVGTHEFEQNLDQNNQNNEAEEKLKTELKKATRKLNIGDIYADDNIEELDENEIVTAEMMVADGNSMDYKV